MRRALSPFALKIVSHVLHCRSLQRSTAEISERASRRSSKSTSSSRGRPVASWSTSTPRTVTRASADQGMAQRRGDHRYPFIQSRPGGPDEMCTVRRRFVGRAPQLVRMETGRRKAWWPSLSQPLFLHLREVGWIVAYRRQRCLVGAVNAKIVGLSCRSSIGIRTSPRQASPPYFPSVPGSTGPAPR